MCVVETDLLADPFVDSDDVVGWKGTVLVSAILVVSSPVVIPRGELVCGTALVPSAVVKVSPGLAVPEGLLETRTVVIESLLVWDSDVVISAWLEVSATVPV